MVLQAQIHVAKTGLFDKECLEWIKCVAGTKTWNDFKTFWMEKFSNYDLLKQITTKEAGFGVNTVEEEQGYTLEEAMENLAYAATATNTQIDTLTKTNSKLAEQLKKA
eukprot:8926235-Ditylum_brightwellii.AAC.1